MVATLVDRSGSDPSDSIELRRVITQLWRRRWWIAASTALVTAGFIAIALTMTPIYRSTAVLVPASSDADIGTGGLSAALGQLGGLASLAGLSLSTGTAQTEEALAVMRSRQFIERFIADNNLMPTLFPKKWDPNRRQWKVPEAGRPTPSQSYRYFSKKVLSVTQDKKSKLVTLQIYWRDRQQAAAWANEFVRRINAEMRSRVISQSDASIKYLQTELSKTSEVSIREAISRLMEAQIKQRMIANVTQEYAFRVVDQAMIPDRDEKVTPRRTLMAIAGFLLGLTIGIVGAIWFERFRPVIVRQG